MRPREDQAPKWHITSDSSHKSFCSQPQQQQQDDNNKNNGNYLEVSANTRTSSTEITICGVLWTTTKQTETERIPKRKSFPRSFQRPNAPFSIPNTGISILQARIFRWIGR
ncbi:hypothetical protein VTK73DRAFT_6090 [Phialemonium thermophilum]|uniref:Uncharacterized protein n=1 Tax=Phialemonium thermophilum TaxID=223376 RepID=A0ABR3WLA7_9PEZI